MSNESTGGAYERRGKWFARVAVSSTDRRSKLLPGITSREAAVARAAAINGLVRQLRDAGRVEYIEKVIEQAAAASAAELAELAGIVAGICAGTEKPKAKALPERVETFRTVLNNWTSGEIARQYPDYVERKRAWRDDTYRAKHVPDEFQKLPLVAWTVDTYEKVMASLPAHLGSGSRRHVAQLVHRVFELAVYPLRLVTVNPVPRLPKVKQDRLLATLYPQDLAAVAACASVELGYRVLWSFLAETGWRISEATGRDEPQDRATGDTIPALCWRDIDFAHERAFLSRTKTTEAVIVPLDEPTLEGLTAWKAISPRTAPADPVFVTMKGEPITVVLAAETFRAHLTAAGITRETRPDLFPEGDEKKKRLAARVHDIRGLFVTASLAQGRSDTWVRERTRHETPQMLDRYRRNVPHFRKYGPIVPMVEAVPEVAAAVKATPQPAANRRQNQARSRKYLFRRRDSNPNKRIQNTGSVHATGSEQQDSRPIAGVDDDGRCVSLTSPPVAAASSGGPDAVEVALAKALEVATSDGRWDVVSQLAMELEARRVAHAGNVVPMGSRGRRGSLS